MIFARVQQKHGKRNNQNNWGHHQEAVQWQPNMALGGTHEKSERNPCKNNHECLPRCWCQRSWPACLGMSWGRFFRSSEEIQEEHPQQQVFEWPPVESRKRRWYMTDKLGQIPCPGWPHLRRQGTKNHQHKMPGKKILEECLETCWPIWQSLIHY